MASSSSSSVTVFFLLIIFSIFAISATARPCKTIFFITSSSFSSNNFPNLQNPNSNSNSNSPHRLTFFITEIHQSHRTTSFPIHHPSFQNDVVPSSKPSSSSSSITMDIMSIVGALLFGVGCGALTAATLYLIWSLPSNRADDDYVSDCSDVDDDDVSNKNVTYDGGESYVAVPVKEVPPTADEVDAMK